MRGGATVKLYRCKASTCTCLSSFHDPDTVLGEMDVLQMEVHVHPSPDLKCQRCWKFTRAADAHEDLCERCVEAMPE